MSPDETVGVVISAEDSPSTTQFAFVLREGCETLKKGQFVEVVAGHGRRIAASIVDIFSSNPYAEDRLVAREIFGNNASINFPVEECQTVYGIARIIGEIEDGGGDGIRIRKCALPPSPGDAVVIPPEEHVRRMVGIEEDGLLVGCLLFQPEVEVKLNVTKLLRKHLAILAMSGAGKSYTAGVILEELLKKGEKGHPMPAILIIDPHGEYTVYAEDERFARMTRVFRGSEVKFSLADVLDYDLISRVVHMSTSSVRRKAAKTFVQKVGKFFRDRGPFTPEDILACMDSLGLSKKEQEVGEEIVEMLTSYGVFSNINIPNLLQMEPSKLYILDLSDLESMAVKQLIVRLITQQLFRLRINGAVPPFLLVVEEAHNFAPSQASKYEALAKEPIETLAREGRKFYACLCLVSQRPYYLSPTALAQCNTHIIMRVTNPNDLNHVRESCESLTREALDMITTFQPGECVIMGEAVHTPVFVKIRERECKAEKFEKSLEDAVREWVEERKRIKGDLEAFL